MTDHEIMTILFAAEHIRNARKANDDDVRRNEFRRAADYLDEAEEMFGTRALIIGFAASEVADSLIALQGCNAPSEIDCLVEGIFLAVNEIEVERHA